MAECMLIPANRRDSYRNIGELVISPIPLEDAGLHLLDGSLLTQGGFYDDFINHMIALYNKLLPEATDNYNINARGSLVNTQGILSNFNSTSWATLPEAFNPSSNSWTINLKFKTGTIGTEQYLFHNGVGYQSLSIVLNSSGNLMVESFVNNTSTLLFNLTGTTVLQANTDYWIKVSFDNTGYSLSLSTDGETFNTEASNTITTSISQASTTTALGVELDTTGAYYQGAWTGSIDINDTNIVINDALWWEGTTKVVPCFTDETTWQDSISTKGVCGKFVYDKVNSTIRLPKVTGFIEGTIDLTALGELVEAGLPNIIGTMRFNGTDPERESASSTGCITTSYWTTGGNDHDGGIGHGGVVYNFNASRSSSLYKNNFNKVQPQAIGTYYYIVVANVTKLPVEADIDKIATDLNGKAGIDLSNLNNTGTSSIVHNTRTSNNYYQYTLGASGSTYTMLFDGELHFACRAPSDNVNHVPYSELYNTTQDFTINGGSSYDIGWTLVMKVKKGDVVMANYGNQATGRTGRLRLYACVGNESEVQ